VQGPSNWQLSYENLPHDWPGTGLILWAETSHIRNIELSREPNSIYCALDRAKTSSLEKVSYRCEKHRAGNTYPQAKKDSKQEGHPWLGCVFDQE
jgi:hypothetical protein